MSEESTAPPQRTAGRSISLPSSDPDAGGRGRPPSPGGRHLSRRLSSHLDRCMSAHSYHAAARRQPAAVSSSSPARSSVIAAALGGRRFSFVEEVEPLAAPSDVEEAAAAAAAARAAAAAAPAAEPSSSRETAAAPRGTVLEGATILFTAVASFPALSLPWATSTMGGWPGVAAVALCGVATAFYSCWLMSYLVGYRPPPPGTKEGAAAGDGDDGVFSIFKEQQQEEGEGGKEEESKAAAAAATAAADSIGNGSGGGGGSDGDDFRHARYHDVAACILGHRTASLFVTPVQVVVCFGICVSSVLVGGQSLKALSRLLAPEDSEGRASSPLTLSQWISVYAALQASSAFVPSLASSAAVAVAGSLAFLLFWLIATWLSAAAGVQRHSSGVPLPADFYSLAAGSPRDRAFAALSGLGVALFAWSNAFAPEVQATLRRPHGATMRRSTLAAFGALVPCYALIAALGFWAFGKSSNVLVLLNMEPASRGGVAGGPEGGAAAPRAAVAVAWLAVLVNLYALFAVYAFPVYECLDAFVARAIVGGIRRKKKGRSREAKKGESGGGGTETEKGAPPPPPAGASPPPPPRLASAVAARAAGRLLFCACCTLLAAALPFFGDIAAVLGVLALALDFVLPCLMFLKVRGGTLKGAAAWALLGTAGFYVTLGGGIMVAALRSLFLNARTYKLFADL